MTTACPVRLARIRNLGYSGGGCVSIEQAFWGKLSDEKSGPAIQIVLPAGGRRPLSCQTAAAPVFIGFTRPNKVRLRYPSVLL